MKTFKLTCIILLLSLAGYAQTTKTLVADETELVMLKSSFKIETSNETIFKLMEKEFNGIGFKYTATIKGDRAGLYRTYSIPFKMLDLDRVKNLLNRINKK